jgi:WS/DGAT/MGAT family acyltransferase
MPPDRLTTIDSSFLRVESPAAHMHVGWRGGFRAASERAPVTLPALRALVAGRVCQAQRFRQRLAFPPAALGEPVWVDDERFDVAHHVRGLSDPTEAVTRARFTELADEFLSHPLDRSRALWEIGLVAKVRGGTQGIVMKVHHAMVDGKSAVALALLLLDVDPDAAPVAPAPWSPARAPAPGRLALDALRDSGAESLRMATGLATLATSPKRGARLADTLRRAALSAAEELMHPAPSSFLNVTIGPRRRLLSHAAPVAELLEVKRRTGATLNDVALAVIAGALRRLALARGTLPMPLKVMVPVSVRSPDDAAALGNRISFAFIALPLHVEAPLARLVAVSEGTRRFKEAQHAAGHSTLLEAVGRLPEPLKNRAARLAASPRTFNFTASNVPGPRQPVYLLGARLVEAYPVVPLSEGHSLSIGMFSYCDRFFFGCYADPEALPDCGRLPRALAAARAELVAALHDDETGASAATVGPAVARAVG